MSLDQILLGMIIYIDKEMELLRVVSETLLSILKIYFSDRAQTG